MTKDEALDLALEALETCDGGTSWADPYQIFDPKLVEKAITAIKQARALDKMAENARELGLDYEPVLDVSLIDEGKTAAPVQPVAWIEHHKGGDNLEWENPGGKCTPLYTTPPAQPAVPDALTSADIQEHIEYVAGWNDCRQAMLEMMK